MSGRSIVAAVAMSTALGFDAALAAGDEWRDSEWIAVDGVPVLQVAEKDLFGGKIDTVPGVSCFIKSIEIGEGVVSARWVMTGQGVFEAYLNGARVGNDFLKPGNTHVKKTRSSFSYDVTAMLKPGRNVLGAMVSTGWWSDKIACYLGKERAFRAKLTVRYVDGTEKVFATDSTWRGAVDGPVKQASIFEGERYDARVGTDWLVSGAGDGFKPVKVIDEFKGSIVPMEGPAISLREDLVLNPAVAYVWRGAAGAAADRFGKVEKVRTYGNGEPMTLGAGEHLVIDFAQNAAAVPRFVASAAAGVKLTIRPGEMLNDGNGLRSRGNDGPEGSVYRANLRTLAGNGALAEYVFAGRGEEEYMPRFSFFGYRYVSVEATGPVTFRKFVSVPVTSISKEMEAGIITTGNADVNRLIENVRWGQYSNYLSVPTDCPQRDERLGWMADTQVFVDAASRNADVYGFLCKWMRDVRDTQDPRGGFLGVAPGGGPYGNESMRLGWSDAGVIVPYKMWKRYGDTRIVKENFEAMDRFVRRVNETKYAHDAIRGESGLYQWADWLSMEALETFSSRAFVLDAQGRRVCPKPEALLYWDYLGGCHWLSDAQMMAEMASAVGRDRSPYAEMAKAAREYMRQFFGADGMLEPPFRDMQTPTLFALRLGLVEGEARKATIAELRRNLSSHGNCLQTGFLGTSIIMQTLTENGLADIAYTLLLQHAFPSWLYSVDQGATTIWERWNSYTKANGFGSVNMNSFNHYSYGAVLEWMYACMAGIRADPAVPGFRHFIFAPIPDRRIGSVKAEYRSAAGLIKSSWRFGENGVCNWDYTIPAGAKATVILPDGRTFERGEGSYSDRF